MGSKTIPLTDGALKEADALAEGAAGKSLTVSKQAKQARRLAALARTAKLMLRNYSHADIASDMGVSVGVVKALCREIRLRWTEELDEAADGLKAAEVAKLDDYERKFRHVMMLEMGKKHYENAARLFDRIFKVIELRTELTGLRRPKETITANINNQIGMFNYEQEGGTGRPPAQPVVEADNGD